MKRILVVRYSALGDVVLATAVLRALRAAHPGATLEALTQVPYVPVLAPWCDHVWTLDRSVPRLREIARLGPALRDRGFDVVLDLQRKVTSRLLARFTGAPAPRPQRARGTESASRPEVRFGRPGELPDPGVLPHALDRYARAAAPLLDGTPLPPPAVVVAGGRAGGRRALDAIAPRGDGPCVVLLPGASHAPKRWGAGRFGALAALVARWRSTARIVLTGGPMDCADVELALAAARAAGAGASVAAHLTAAGVGELLALVAGADLVVAGDTGALHLAAAAGTPSIGLYGPTDPRVWAPPGVTPLWRHPPCAPCSTHGQRACAAPRRWCLDDLAPQDVLEVVKVRLASALERGAAGAVEA